MKILVTGGAGFIGTNLCEALVETNDVHSIDNYSKGFKKNHIKNWTYHFGDILNIEDIINNDFDLCFHLAALSRIQPSFENPHHTFLANTTGTERVLEWARKNNTKVIYSGSSSKHHNPKKSPYALYKYLGEEICKMYKETYNLNVEIARFYNVYGPREIINGQWAAVIGIWRSQIKEKKPITIVGDGYQKRDFTHVKDIVDGLIKISKTELTNDDAWELGSGRNFSINEVANLFKKKYNCTIKYISDQKGNYRETLRKDDEALNKLNWNPKESLVDYINSL
jgi:UDP-glucose 4-epimerase